MARNLAFLCVALLVAVACKPRSPFAVHPAQLAIESPCRYMGTVHKESRGRLEVMRACDSISRGEWLCLVRALESIDTEFTARCRDRFVPFHEIADEQRMRYLACLGPSRGEDAVCAVLSAETRCLTRGCS